MLDRDARDRFRSTKLWAALWDSLHCKFAANQRKVQLLEISDMLKLQSPRSTEFPSEIEDLKFNGVECTVAARTPGPGSENWRLQPLQASIAEPAKAHPLPYERHQPPLDQFKVLTWNACAISFPLHIHPVKFVAGLMLGCWWHDGQCDVPMHLDHCRAQARFARQAEYIQQSGADLVLLQEVLSTSMVQGLMRHLSEDFDHTYLKSSPKPAARLLWMAFLVMIALVQCTFIQLPLRAIRSTEAEGTWVFFCLRWMILTAALALRWRNSVPAQFLFGDVAGQLVVLRRKGCQVLAGPIFRAEGFDIYDADFRTEGRRERHAAKQESAIETASWLSVFFNVRPRGVLRVMVAVELAGKPAVLTLLNTHMPHNCDNSDLLHTLGRRAADLAAEGPVILAGDFNPLPDILLQHQLEPLLKFGLQATDGLSDEFCTWDLSQALTRENAGTPRTMQLDFIFHLRQKAAQMPRPTLLPVRDSCAGLVGFTNKGPREGSGTMPGQGSPGSFRLLDLAPLSTTIADQDKFFCEGPPLSDHYGLITEFQIGWRL